VKDEFKERLKNLEIQLDMLEKQPTFNELDMHISKAEISKAISKLKCGKSPGLDNISTNMLKCAQNELYPGGWVNNRAPLIFLCLLSKVIYKIPIEFWIIIM
jgi:hypothetical protein